MIRSKRNFLISNPLSEFFRNFRIVLLEKLAVNNIFLLFNYYSYMGTKIYDYLGLKRLILLCYDNDENQSAEREVLQYERKRFGKRKFAGAGNRRNEIGRCR